MPRQNFISKDFFLFTPEEAAKRALLSLPDFVSPLSYVGENRLLQSWRFLYENTKSAAMHIDVALLPLNDGHVRVTLHGAYANGHSFYRDTILLSALENFEAAFSAAVGGTIEKFEAVEPKASSSTKLVHLVMSSIHFLGVSSISRKLTGGSPF